MTATWARALRKTGAMLAIAPVLWSMIALGVVPGARTAWGASAGRRHLDAFRERVDGLLQDAGLDAGRLSLLLYSTRQGYYLYRRNIHRPMIAASNAKLVTSYAALKVLSPDYRWRTRFFLTEDQGDQGDQGDQRDQDDAEAPARQGLLVRGSGDPTLTAADLDRIALLIRSRGIGRLEGGIRFDGSLFDDVKFPASWGDVSRNEPWFAPVSPFIVEKNVIEFFIAERADPPGFEIFTTAPGFRTVSRVRRSLLEKPQLWVEQDWHGDSATFTFEGALAPKQDPYLFSAAVERPRVHFYRLLRASLRRAGIEGEIPLRLQAPPPRSRRLLHTQKSPPLREVIVEVNKHSSNLAAEVLLRTMGLYEKPGGLSTEDGLAVLRRVMDQSFYQAPQELTMVDGSGLSRKNRVSALLLVRLLNRVRNDFRLRPEFINSLSVALTDGTLEFRGYPPRMKGQLRAKTGSLNSVSNLSGFLQLKRDVIVFSFLIHDEGQPFALLQETQDAVMVRLYDALLELEVELRRDKER